MLIMKLLSTKLLSGIFLLAVVAFTFASCNNDDGANPTPRTVTYDVNGYEASGITGKIKFTEVVNADSVSVLLTLNGQDINQYVHFPVVINKGTALEEGEELFPLGTFDGGKGSLQKAVNISYDDLVKLNGGVTIYSGSADKDVVAHAEIGVNKTFSAFSMKTVDGVVNGQFRVYKRDTGSYLVIKVDSIGNSCQGMDHPVYALNNNEQDTTLQINPVADQDLISTTELPNHRYEDLTTYGGVLNVYCSESNTLSVISKGKFVKQNSNQ